MKLLALPVKIPINNKNILFRKLITRNLDGIDIYLDTPGPLDKYFEINPLRQPELSDLPDSSNWTSQLYKGKQTPLNQICIPGSHNVDTQEISVFSSIDPAAGDLRAFTGRYGNIRIKLILSEQSVMTSIPKKLINPAKKLPEPNYSN